MESAMPMYTAGVLAPDWRATSPPLEVRANPTPLKRKKLNLEKKLQKQTTLQLYLNSWTRQAETEPLLSGFSRTASNPAFLASSSSPLTLLSRTSGGLLALPTCRAPGPKVWWHFSTTFFMSSFFFTPIPSPTSSPSTKTAQYSLPPEYFLGERGGETGEGEKAKAPSSAEELLEDSLEASELPKMTPAVSGESQKSTWRPNLLKCQPMTALLTGLWSTTRTLWHSSSRGESGGEGQETGWGTGEGAGGPFLPLKGLKPMGYSLLTPGVPAACPPSATSRKQSKKKVVPTPRREAKVRFPPIMLTRRWQMVRPIPVPPWRRVVEVSAWVKGLKMEVKAQGGIPTPETGGGGKWVNYNLAHSC